MNRYERKNKSEEGAGQQTRYDEFESHIESLLGALYAAGANASASCVRIAIRLREAPLVVRVWRREGWAFAKEDMPHFLEH